MMPANAPSTPVTKTLAKCLGIEQMSAGRTQTFEALNGALFNESRSAIVLRQWRGVPDRRSENVETFVGGHGGLRRMVDEIVGEELLEDIEGSISYYPHSLFTSSTGLLHCYLSCQSMNPTNLAVAIAAPQTT
jgi:hypothetical protein